MTRRPAVLLAVVWLSAIAFVVVFAGAVSDYDPLAQNAERRLVAPGGAHLFGTDGFGRDVFSRVVHGGRASLGVAGLSVALAGAVGLAVGTATGYVGGRTDAVVGRVVDVFLGFPFLVLSLMIVVALSPAPVTVAIAIAVSLAPQVTRVARASALAVRSEEYLTVVRSTGAGTVRIVVRHLLPASAPPVVAYLIGAFATALGAEATLSFLGLGVPPPYPSWGRMLQEGSRAYFEAAPWVTLIPGAILSLTIVSCVVVADAVTRRVDDATGGSP
ncbi:MAG: ABC transporter permease [Spirochaetaceae bacterium]|nr:MAG: ABC transporter permease [Spirochaetaceae bacterium]